MTTRLLLLADTHVPTRAKRLPDDVWREVDRADVVVHAGDWIDLATFEALHERSARLIGVWGNNDGPELRERMPEFAVEQIEGLRVGVVHETGAASGRERRMDADYAHEGLALLIFGHSHIPWDSVTPGGIRLLNPGSPTDRRRQPHCTLMTAVVENDELAELIVQRVSRPPEASRTHE